MSRTTPPKISQTKIKLTEALLCLINEEDREFDEITVRDISRVSGLSRTTFYNNFLDIYDLAFFVFELESMDAVKLMFEEDNFIKSFT
ncbi:MAG: TetR/AcrR family transcriptional regulator, partial [Fastidiosipila sp.]|nr:TetR/AcrR family transcriptional regulator [Fastidiosipila sp.]